MGPPSSPAPVAPGTSPNATDPTIIELVSQLRSQLEQQGLDAGAHTICWHLRDHHGITISPAPVWRHLHKHGAITPPPQKRPRSSYRRFAADLPHQLWQTGFTHVRLADDTDVEVLSFLADHSRYALSVTTHKPVTGGAVVSAFNTAAQTHGVPAGVLSDNGMVFTTRFAGGRGGRNKFKHRLQQLGMVQNWLHRQPQTRVLMLIHDLDIRVTHATTGALIRQLHLDPTRDFSGW